MNSSFDVLYARCRAPSNLTWMCCLRQCVSPADPRVRGLHAFETCKLRYIEIMRPVATRVESNAVRCLQGNEMGYHATSVTGAEWALTGLVSIA